MQSKEIKQQMFAKIKQWQQSGLSQKQYCLQNSIAYHIFHYWYKLYRNHQPHSFIPISIQTLSAVNIELHLPDGKRLLFHQAISVDFLKALIA